MTIIGRDAELRLVSEYLGRDEGARALFIAGGAGIGKTTIWQHALAVSGGRGDRVVTTRPTEAEAKLPFAGLNDLFGDLVDDVRPELPAPQREALDVALLKSSASPAAPQPLAVSLAVLGLVRSAAADRPLTVAIDDVQWLDESTASVLEFVARRLDDERVIFLIAARTGGGPDSARPPTPVVRALDAARVTPLHVRPLAAADLQQLVSATVGLDLAPSSVRRLHRMSGGNPFYAIEIARALQRRGVRVITDDVTLPDSLQGIVADRLAALSPAARAVVAHASALSRPDRATIEAALGADAAAAGLADAAASGVLSESADELRFDHPLLAAAAYSQANASERREIHRRLAESVGDDEERAGHLALAVEGPDEDVAAALERASERAASRGAPDAAGDLAERAAELTSGDEAALHRRSVAAARFRVLSGDLAGARGLLEAALARGPTGDRRAEILTRLGHVRELADDWGAAEELFREALRHARHDLRVKVDAKLMLGGVAFITGHHWRAGARHVTDAMRLAEKLGDPRVLAATIGPYSTWRYVTGHPVDLDLERRALELEPWMDHLRSMDRPAFDFSFRRASEGDWAGFRQAHEALAAHAERLGDYSSLPFLLANLTGADFREGRADRAAGRLDEAERLVRTTGGRTALAHLFAWRAQLAARLGDADTAWRYGQAVLDTVEQTGWMIGLNVCVHLAELELSRNDPIKALELLEVLDHEPPRELGWMAIHVEALVSAGHLDDARRQVSRAMRDARTGRPTATRAALLAASALVAAAEGDLARATSLAEEASAIVHRLDDRWLLARTQLIAGEIHRRGRRRAMAREALTEAVEAFDALGARLWAARARDELSRIGGARQSETGLTPTQLQIAELVAEGLTNRQVAERLFMSAHTVEAHLTAAYRALGIRSRAELAAALAAATQGDPPDSDVDPRDSSPKPRPKT